VKKVYEFVIMTTTPTAISPTKQHYKPKCEEAENNNNYTNIAAPSSALTIGVHNSTY